MTDESFTDLVFTIPGHRGLDDPQVEPLVMEFHERLEKEFDADVGLASHGCNDDFETYHSLLNELKQHREKTRAFCVSFGVKYHHEPHPEFGGPIPQNSYVIVLAKDELEARRIAFENLDWEWGFLYTAEEFYAIEPRYIGPVIAVLTKNGMFRSYMTKGNIT